MAVDSASNCLEFRTALANIQRAGQRVLATHGGTRKDTQGTHVTGYLGARRAVSTAALVAFPWSRGRPRAALANADRGAPRRGVTWDVVDFVTGRLWLYATDDYVRCGRHTEAAFVPPPRANDGPKTPCHHLWEPTVNRLNGCAIPSGTATWRPASIR